jgi:hypothetical protein
MAMRKKLALTALTLVCTAPLLVAHHGWTIDYDPDKPVAVKGVVTKLEWTNPHIHFYVDSTNDKGAVTSWNFEMASPLALQRGGWSRKSLPIGAKVEIGGFAGRAVAERAVANSIKLDGKEMFTGRLGQ